MRLSMKNIRDCMVSAVLAIMLFTGVEVRADVEEVYLTPHFHYDPVFQEDQNDYTDVGFDRVRRFMECLIDDPDYAVVFSEIDYLKPYFDTFPEDREKMLELVGEGRIETGGSYNEPNEMSIGGEGIIRNIIYGRAYHEGVLGERKAEVYMPFDVFGHCMQLSQILAKSRFKGALWRKGNPPSEKWVRKTVPGLPPDFMDLSPDGTMLHHRREHYKAVSGTVSREDLANDVKEKKRLQDTLGLAAEYGLLSSADFAYPETWLKGQCGLLKENDPPIIISGPAAYFRRIQEQVADGGAELPVVSRDLSLYHAGTALSRVNLKIANRLSENAIAGAEKFSVAAALMGAKYPGAALDKAWRQLLFNQHHDGITGTCCDRSYFDMMAGYREALELATDAYTGAAGFIASRIETSGLPEGSVPLAVFNQSGWERTDVVSTPMLELPWGDFRLLEADGQEIPFEIIRTRNDGDRLLYSLRFIAESVPSVGYKTFYFVEAHGDEIAPELPATSDLTIGNEFYSVTVDPERGGTITGIVDKGAARQVIPPGTPHPGNEIIVLKEDEGPQYPAWELSTTGVIGKSSDYRADVEVERNAVAERFIVRGEIGDLGGYEQEISLYPGVKRIDIMTTILDPETARNAQDRNLWMVRFPAELNGTAPVVEDRFFAAARRRSLRPLEYRTDLEKMNTLSAPYSAMRWAEEGVAVRIDVKDDSGEVIGGAPLKLCEIVHSGTKSSTAAAEELMEALIQKGVACTPSLDTEDKTKDLLNRNTRFVLDTSGDNEYAGALLESNEGSGDFKKRLEADGVARILLSVPSGDPEIGDIDTLLISAANEGSMDEAVAGIVKSIKDRSVINVSVSEDARGVVLQPPDDYGIALLNRGNILHSFDANGAIVIGLFHSAPWESIRMGVDFWFTEEKNHRYSYSLYPHTGDWRDADTWRRGHEYNSPLKCVTAGGRGENLPLVMSLVNVESEHVALSAIKAAGDPYASMKTGETAGPRRGVVLRFYEAEGRGGEVSIKFFRPVKSAIRANLLEEPLDGGQLEIIGGESVKMAIGPNAIETILVEFEDAAEPRPDETEIAPEREDADILYTNYWDVNRGAADMNNSPVSVSLGFPLEKKLPDPELLMAGIGGSGENTIRKGVNELRLVVSNNSADEPLEGTLSIEVPEGWKAKPGKMNIDFSPLEGKAIEVKVLATRPVDGGYIRAVLETDQGKYFGSIPVGDPELAAGAEIVKTQETGCMALEVSLENTAEGSVDGSVQPVGPVETWPVELAGALSLVETKPRIRYFSIPAGESKKLSFSVCESGRDLDGQYYWQMVKVAYNGLYKYLPVVYGAAEKKTK